MVSSNSRKTKKNSKCVPLSQVKKELNDLLLIAMNNNDTELVNIFKKQINDLTKSKSQSKLKTSQMTGGASKICHAITSAMFLSSGAAISILSYYGAMPIIEKAMPKLCNGTWDQFLGATMGKVSKDFSCESRQAAWDKLRAAVITAAGGIPTVIASIKELRGKFSNTYRKVLSWNEKHICPFLSQSSISIKDAACFTVKAPISAIKSIAQSTRHSFSSSRKGSFFNMLHGQESPSSSSSSSSSSKGRSRSRTPAKSRTVSSSSSTKSNKSVKKSPKNSSSNGSRRLSKISRQTNITNYFSKMTKSKSKSKSN